MSAWGAAASIVVLLIWVYYTAQLVLMGAEFTNV
jgi:membrane protein